MPWVINGQVSDGGLPADDRAFLLGDALFETILAQDGKLLAWQRHWDRLRASAAALGFALPRTCDQARADVALALRLAGVQQATAAVRLTLTRGRGPRGFWPDGIHQPLLVVQAAPYTPSLAPLRAALVAEYPRNPLSPLSHHKTTSALELTLAQRAARLQGADLALLVNTDGRLTEGAFASLFLVIGGQILTPPLTEGLLPGIARALLLERLRIEERVLSPSCLQAAEAAFVSNSLMGVRALSGVDGHRLDVAHPRVRAAQAAWLTILQTGFA